LLERTDMDASELGRLRKTEDDDEGEDDHDGAERTLDFDGGCHYGWHHV
jgi:hypothetical protein